MSPKPWLTAFAYVLLCLLVPHGAFAQVLIPTRAVNQKGQPGDMVNLLFIGQKVDIQQMFVTAGWVEVNKMDAQLFWHLLFQRKHYVRLPMRTLYLFNRPQDLAYALPDPTAMLARRHHLRIWKTAYEEDGCPLWAGAAIHDIGIKFVKRRWWLIHKIDPDVDAEREFIAKQLITSNLVSSMGYVSSVIPILNAQTTDGAAYHSDGRMLLLKLR